MKDNHAQARAHEAGAANWIEEELNRLDDQNNPMIIESGMEAYTRDFVISAYQAGYDSAADRTGENPAESLREISLRVAKGLRLEVDHAAFDDAADRLGESVRDIDPGRERQPPTVVDVIQSLHIDDEAGFNPDDVVEINGVRFVRQPDGEPEDFEFGGVAETAFRKRSGDDELCYLLEGLNADDETIVILNGMRYVAEEMIGANWDDMIREVIQHIDRARDTVDAGADKVSRFADDLKATLELDWPGVINEQGKDSDVDQVHGDRPIETVADITSRLPTRKESSNLKPITDGPLGDPKVVDALVNVTSQDPDAEVRAAPHRVGGVADLLAFRVTTGDPRFQPDKPVTINGFLYRPVDVPTERKE